MVGPCNTTHLQIHLLFSSLEKLQCLEQPLLPLGQVLGVLPSLCCTLMLQVLLKLWSFL